jgi:AcrR family transcriptional regulator
VHLPAASVVRDVIAGASGRRPFVQTWEGVDRLPTKMKAAKVPATEPSAPRAREDKHGAILDAALEVFAEHGVDGVAVPEIAARARVATGTIYRYFPSKEALVNELYRKKKEALGQRLNVAVDRNREPKELFAAFWERMVSFAREEPQAYRFLELQDHRPYLDDDSLAMERAVLGPMTARVKELQTRGVFRKDVRHEVIMALMWGAFVNLFKAERDGHIKLSSRDISAARDACWRMFVA